VNRSDAFSGAGDAGTGRNRNHIINTRLFLALVLIFLLMGIPTVEGSTRCVNVTPATDCDYTYSTITLALNAAGNYDTIRVGPGLYKERITITKQVSLLGASAGVPKKDYDAPTEAEDYAHDSVTQSVINPKTADSATVVTISSANVTIDGFIIYNTDAPTPSSVYPATYLINVGGAVKQNNITIRNNVLGPNTNLTNKDGNSGRMAITISKHPTTNPRENNIVHNLKIQNNMIYDAKGDGCGILMIGERNLSTSPVLAFQFKGAVIDNNTISGNHRSGIDFSGAVQGGIDPADHIMITNNRIINNGWNSTVDKDNIKWGNGIVFLRLTDNQNNADPVAERYIDIENNEFSGNEKNGIYFGPVVQNISIRNNIFQNNGIGTSPRGTTGYNTTWDGIRIDLNETYQIEELLRHPEQPQYQGITFYDHINNITISENSFSGNGGYGLQVTHAPMKGLIDARRNWWGSSSGPKNTLINPGGTGEKVSAFTRLSPWYTNAGKTGTQSSASGNSGILPVSHVIPGNYTTIQAAINAALSGDTVKVYPGSYDERIFINRSVTLLGATSGISKKDYSIPSGYAYDETKESIISPSSDKNEPVIQIRFGTVTVDGFIVANLHANQHPELAYPYTDLISINNNTNQYEDVTIKNNVIGPNTNIDSQDGTKGRMGVVVPGPYQTTMYDLTISNNKIFNASGDGNGILLLGSQNTSTPALAAKYRGLIIDNNTVSGNHRSGIEFSGGVQGSADTAGHIRITSNNITSNGGYSTADKDNLKYGNGIILIRIGSDKSTYNYQYSSAWGSRYVDIDNNVITKNEKNGIYIGPSNRYITITNNILSENGAGTGGFSKWDGVQVDLDESYHKATDKNYGNLTNIVLKGNDIISNGDYGIRVIQTPTLGSIDARNNWWGSAGGPRTTTDAAGTASNVSSNVLFQPWYTSPARSTASTLPKPIAAFTVNPVEDMVGATFSFDASLSESQSSSTITSYQWNYGDGNTSTAGISPTTTWTYTTAKVHTITLTVKDTNGMTNSTTRDITVIAKREAVPLTFSSTTESGTAGNQELVVDTTKGTVSNSTSNLTIKDPGTGWEEMTVIGNTSKSGDEITIKNITEVVLKGKPIVTELNTSSSGVGAVSTSIQLALTNFTSAPLQVEVTEGANSTISSGFQLAAGSTNSVDAIAYTMTIKGSSLINSNLSKSSDPVVLNMSVSETWVNAHGGIGSIKIIRYSDDGSTKEVLETQYLFTAGAPAMCYFKVISPHGCSVFGVASVVAVPQTSQGGRSASGSSSSSSRRYVSSESGRQPEQKGPLQPAEGEPGISEPAQVSQPAPTLAAPLDKGGEEGEIPIAGAAEKEVVKSLGMAFAFVADNIIAICMGAAAVTVCVGLILRHRRRQQYWR
jgi:hypothetical protein